MTFNTQFFDLAVSGPGFAELAKGAADRLSTVNPTKLSTEAAATIAGSAATQAEVRRSAQHLAQVETANTDRQLAFEQEAFGGLHGDLDELKAIEGANLGVNIAQTAILAAGLSALYQSFEKHREQSAAQLASIEKLSLQQRLLLEQQLDTNRQILHVLQQSRRNEAQQLFSQGEKLMEAGYADEAVERYRKALEFDATDPQVLFGLALAYVKTANIDAAADVFKRAATFAKDAPHQFAQLVAREYARFLAACGKFSDAIETLSWIEHSWTAEDRYDVALYMLAGERFDEARAAITALVNADFQMLTRLAFEPRVGGSSRLVLDLWLEDLARQFARWHSGYFVAARQYAAKVRQGGGADVPLHAADALLGVYRDEAQDFATFIPSRALELALQVNSALLGAQKPANAHISGTRALVSSARTRLDAGAVMEAAEQLHAVAKQVGIEETGRIQAPPALTKIELPRERFAAVAAVLVVVLTVGFAAATSSAWGGLAGLILGAGAVAGLKLVARRHTQAFLESWHATASRIMDELKPPPWMALPLPVPPKQFSFQKPGLGDAAYRSASA